MLAIAFAFTLYFLAQITLLPLWIYIVGGFTGLGFEIIMDVVTKGQLDDPGAANALRWINGGNGILSWGLPAVLMAMFLGKPRQALSLDQKPAPFSILLGILLIIASLPLVQAITFDSSSFELPSFMAGMESAMEEMEVRATAQLMKLLGDTSMGVLLANIVVFAIIPAICEELFFRGFIQQKLGKVAGPHAAIWITAAIFSLMHLQFYGFFGRLFLGALLGYLLYRSGSLWPSIIAHFTYNAINVVFAWGAFKYGWADPEMLEGAPAIPWTIWLPAAVAFGGLFYVFYKRGGTAGSEKRDVRPEREPGTGN
jgi:membrane protease YdiL (CAAX protease family)